MIVIGVTPQSPSQAQTPVVYLPSRRVPSAFVKIRKTRYVRNALSFEKLSQRFAARHYKKGTTIDVEAVKENRRRSPQ